MINKYGVVEFLLELSARQINERQLFSKELLDYVKKHVGMEKAVIICFDTHNNFLSWIDENGVRSDTKDHPYRKFSKNDVVEHVVYHTSAREKLTYFNTEPKIYRSTEVISSVDYDSSAFVRFLEENFNAHYSLTLAFGINAYIQIIFFKTEEEGDFTKEEIDRFDDLYVYIASTYRNFKLLEQTKLISGLKDNVIKTGKKAFFIAEEFDHVLSINENALMILRSIFGDIVEKDISPESECLWLPLIIKDYKDENVSDSICIIKDCSFHVHVYKQEYSHGIIDTYYWITIDAVGDIGIENQGISGYIKTLTTAELKVAELLAKGLTYKEIAAQLVISYHTVKNHVQNIYTKCGIKNRYQLHELFNG